LLDQACAHCPIFPTAASRRSLGRVSVPVWLIILSDQLTIVALVGHYPANKLIVRRLLSRRIAALALGHHAVLAVVSHSCPPPGDRYLRVTHPSATAELPQPCDLHVLSMPPAFALSQDQTLRFIMSPLAEQPDEQTLPLFIRRLRLLMWSIKSQPHKRNCNASKIRNSDTNKHQFQRRQSS
jgi:hypothetical protein